METMQPICHIVKYFKKKRCWTWGTVWTKGFPYIKWSGKSYSSKNRAIDDIMKFNIDRLNIFSGKKGLRKELKKKGVDFTEKHIEAIFNIEGGDTDEHETPNS